MHGYQHLSVPSYISLVLSGIENWVLVWDVVIQDLSFTMKAMQGEKPGAGIYLHKMFLSSVSLDKGVMYVIGIFSEVGDYEGPWT